MLPNLALLKYSRYFILCELQSALKNNKIFSVVATLNFTLCGIIIFHVGWHSAATWYEEFKVVHKYLL
jgi:hypothetical protein